MNRGRLLDALIPGGFALFFIVEALRMPRFGPLYESPGFFPLTIGCLFLSCSIWLFVQNIYRMRINKKESQVEQRPAHFIINTIVIVGSMVAYVVLLYTDIPYTLLTFLFLAGTMFYFEPQKKVNNVIISVVCSVAIYYTFNKIFLITLP